MLGNDVGEFKKHSLKVHDIKKKDKSVAIKD